MDTNDNETVEPEGAEDLPGGSAPGGAQTRPEAQDHAGAASPGEAQSDDVAPDSDPMVNEPSEGEDGDADTDG
jgi:hypothetical protein